MASSQRCVCRHDQIALCQDEACLPKKIKALLESDDEAIMKRPAGAGIGDAGAESVKKRPAGADIDAGANSMMKRPATGAMMKRPSAVDSSAIVPSDDPDARTKDRNKWGFLRRNQDSLDPRVLKMLQRGKPERDGCGGQQCRPPW